ncbi:MAG: hypothetical protein KatS3mg082_1017 [Nitrospiraceae bacterium]|jgi:hypothetical protein|nr:MAG: hypothetical protein KatS3mg082_1017 [Nitrospiraceae bacterium]
MAVPKHLEEAAARLKDASLRISQVRDLPFTAENQKAWLEALSDFCAALSDIQSYNNESVHEKLHELAGRIGLRKFPGSTQPKS